LKLYGYQENPEFRMVMEYATHDTLNRVLQTVTLTKIQQKSMALDMINGLMYLHSVGIIHRDVKSKNFLVTVSTPEVYKVKISDFGYSKFINSITVRLVGTPVYIAPESAFKLIYSFKSDIYALSFTLWELFENDPVPYRVDIPELYAASPIAVLQCIHMQNLRPGFRKLNESYLSKMKEWIKSGWAIEPKDRPELSNALDIVTNLH